jgi:dCMP deaminase
MGQVASSERHYFKPYPGGRQRQSCLQCALPPTHPIHFTPEERQGLENAHDTTADRIDPDEMFLDIAEVISKRSTCNRGHIGCVIVRDRRIVSTGYNGSPPGADHCLDVGCEDLTLFEAKDPDDPHDYAAPHELGCQRTIHAEANAIVFAARYGVALQGASMYSTHSPCGKCAQLIVAAGIGVFRWRNDYRLARLDILKDAGILVVKEVS